MVGKINLHFEIAELIVGILVLSKISQFKTRVSVELVACKTSFAGDDRRVLIEPLALLVQILLDTVFMKP